MHCRFNFSFAMLFRKTISFLCGSLSQSTRYEISAVQRTFCKSSAHHIGVHLGQGRNGNCKKSRESRARRSIFQSRVGDPSLGYHSI